MAVKTNTKGQHLTIHDRTFIEDALKCDLSLKTIASRLGKDPTTISKEIKRNRISKISNSEFKGGCINRRNCIKKHLCSDTCNHLCKKCIKINCLRNCPDFKNKTCSRILKFPHVCNGCDKKISCKLDKFKYIAKQADAIYRDKLETSRQGINMTKAELTALDDLVTPLIMKGQPIAHIYANHKRDIRCSERTLYSYIDMSLLNARNIDLRRKCKYKKRKRNTSVKRKSNHRINRSYEDFIKYIEANPSTDVIELDTVEGSKGGKVIMTLFSRRTSLMVGVLLDSCTQECVLEAFNDLYNSLGHEVYKQSIPIVLTDNGSEFIMPNEIAYDENGRERTRLFYCDPNASYQKGRLERNHEFIRYILPKGKSFDFLTQEKVTHLMNHINSISRKSLNGATPYMLGKLLLNNQLLDVLSLEEIPADEIRLTEDLVDPSYFKRTLLETLTK